MKILWLLIPLLFLVACTPSKFDTNFDKTCNESDLQGFKADYVLTILHYNCIGNKVFGDPVTLREHLIGVGAYCRDGQLYNENASTIGLLKSEQCTCGGIGCDSECQEAYGLYYEEMYRTYDTIAPGGHEFTGKCSNVRYDLPP
jgi:hypothetical protein